MYKLIFRDPDCKQLAPSNKAAIRTYTTDQSNIVGSCSLFVLHPDSNSLKQVTFYVIRHEDSVMLSCVTSLQLSLVQPHNNLENSIPSSASLISSKADYPKKRSQKNMLISKLSTNVSSSKEQYHLVSNSKENHVDQCVKYEEKVKTTNGSAKPMLWKMTRSVNLLFALIRTVRITNVLICGQ